MTLKRAYGLQNALGLYNRIWHIAQIYGSCGQVDKMGLSTFALLLHNFYRRVVLGFIPVMNCGG